MFTCPDIDSLQMPQTPADTATPWADHVRGTAVACLQIADTVGQDLATSWVGYIGALLEQDLLSQGVPLEGPQGVAAVLRRWGACVAGEIATMKRARLH